MKKMILLGGLMILLGVAASAQTGPGERVRQRSTAQGFHSGQLSRPERLELRKNDARYKVARHHARKDGRVGPRERRRLHNMRTHDRRQTFRFKHNRHRRHF